MEAKLPDRSIFIPAGSKTPLPGTSGRCACCDREVTAKNSTRRAPVGTPGDLKIVEAGATPELDIVTYVPILTYTGVRICDACGFNLQDWECERYQAEYDNWEWQWASGHSNTSYNGAHVKVKEFAVEMKRLETYNSFSIKPFVRK